MKVYVSDLTIEGADLEGENPLPLFRDRNHHREVKDDGSFTQEQKIHLGYETGNRYLPYRIQDRYTRSKKNKLLKTIIIENDILKAVFLPDFGGRLYSLKDKRNGREVLYKNPVFQPANLAILNAWFSGGVEWNIGQLGHTFTTCSPVFAAKLFDEEGNQFLRIYEYERCKNIFWHIDFHLPEGSDKLLIYVRIVNDNKNPVPMYWWTNIAVEETPKVRVFSDTDEVIYQSPSFKGFGVDRMPNLPSLPGIDASYPMQIPYSSEYFFQNSKNIKSPWEAVVYEDGRLFFERSTSMLRFRKMFCWGNHTGGRHWCDFLARRGEGNYVEIQGGLAPTQLHGIDMPAGSVWDFTQVMGVSNVDIELSYQEDWKKSRDYIRGHIDNNINDNEVYNIHRKLQTYAQKAANEIIHIGSGWGALERLRRNKMEERGIPQGFNFTDDSLGAPQYHWLVLLEEGYFPESDVKDIPASWMVQEEWCKALVNSLECENKHTWNAFMHFGVMLFEKGEEDKAIEAWENSIKIKPSPWVYRNLSEAMKQKGDNKQALSYMEKAFLISGGFPDRAFAEEYLSLLVLNREFEKAWNVYDSLQDYFKKSDRIQLILGAAAIELDKDEFIKKVFNTEFAVLREGEGLLLELWYRYNAKKLAKERNVSITEDIIKEAMRKYPPPGNIDFRGSGS